VLAPLSDPPFLARAVESGRIGGFLSGPWNLEREKTVMQKGRGGHQKEKGGHLSVELLQNRLQKMENSNQELRERLQTSEARVRYLQSSLQTNAYYARQVQEALLADEVRLQRFFPKSFLFSKPQSVASGDFLWVDHADDKTVLALADCTGHDVRGAFMTLIGHELLTQIVKEQGTTSPELVLHELNLALRKRLKQTETENRDGIDLAVITIDKLEDTLTFAGAKAHALIVRNGEGVYLKGDRHPAGGLQKSGELIYGRQQFPLAGINALYLYSDGFQNQPGGAACTKFLPKRFRRLLAENYQLPPAGQKSLLATRLQNWLTESTCPNNRLMDDVTVVGVQF